MSTVAQPVQEGSRAMASRHVRTRAFHVGIWKLRQCLVQEAEKAYLN